MNNAPEPSQPAEISKNDPSSEAGNALNSKAIWRHNTTGVKGVTQHANGRFRAGITKQGKHIHLGYHETLEAARAARILAEC